MIQNNTIKIALFYLISISFILLNLWFVVKKDSMMLNLMPVFLTAALLVIFSFDKLIWIVVFFAPLSLELSTIMPGLSFDMFLPTEPILVAILILFILKIVHERSFDKKILLHPVSIAIFVNLLWILITSITSTMPLVSFKFLLMRIWFVVAFYFLTVKIFTGGKKMEQYIWLYLAGFLIVISYTLFRHTGYGLLNKQAAHFVVSPFYNDHTSYGAALAMYLPFTVFFTFNRHYSRKIRTTAAIFTVILFVAFVFSYSRAAWLSLILALGVWMTIRLRIPFRPLFITVSAILILIFSFQHEIVMQLERNSDESSSNLVEHFSSMGNISSDASNLERINRWGSAVRMFQERPLFGFGPGTYMFKYAGFQLKKDRTIISTNVGDGGNAHSEYLGPLSESGIAGLATFLIIIITVLYTGIRVWGKLDDKRLKGIVLAAITGLFTYYVHGFLNNFLDTDKLSVPFWGFTAMIAAVDLHQRQNEAKQKKSDLNNQTGSV